MCAHMCMLWMELGSSWLHSMNFRDGAIPQPSGKPPKCVNLIRVMEFLLAEKAYILYSMRVTLTQKPDGGTRKRNLASLIFSLINRIFH